MVQIGAAPNPTDEESKKNTTDEERIKQSGIKEANKGVAMAKAEAFNLLYKES